MGYELEVEAGAAVPDAGGDDACALYREDRYLEDRWQRCDERLVAALAHYRSLRGRVDRAEPAWQAAQLRVAEARQRRQELYDEIVRFEATRGETSAEYE
jgi:hypothetical protein